MSGKHSHGKLETRETKMKRPTKAQKFVLDHATAQHNEMMKKLSIIAHAEGIETLETRGRDCLDFHDISIASLSAMLQAAYLAGKNSAK